MSKTDFYRSCQLKRGNTTTKTHLPEKYAAVGRIVKLKDELGVWSDNWEVIAVGDLIDGKYAEYKAHSYEGIWEPSTKLTSRGNK